jgi:hypothetical protein
VDRKDLQLKVGKALQKELPEHLQWDIIRKSIPELNGERSRGSSG